jgi:hypothetical protein
MRMCRTTGIAVRIARTWVENAEEDTRWGSELSKESFTLVGESGGCVVEA